LTNENVYIKRGGLRYNRET